MDAKDLNDVNEDQSGNDSNEVITFLDDAVTVLANSGFTRKLNSLTCIELVKIIMDIRKWNYNSENLKLELFPRVDTFAKVAHIHAKTRKSPTSHVGNRVGKSHPNN